MVLVLVRLAQRPLGNPTRKAEYAALFRPTALREFTQGSGNLPTPAAVLDGLGHVNWALINWCASCLPATTY